MIYTVTFNPAIDFVISTDKFQTGAINRSKSDHIYYGGKGINVSKILNELGITSTALGFIAGFTGEQIEKGLKSEGILTDFVHLKEGYSRINIKIRSDDETDINTQGPEISEYDLHLLYKKLEKLNDNDILIISGSVPASMNDDIYEKLLSKIKNKSITTVIDATGEKLKKTLKYKPFLIKPNLDELKDIFSTDITTDQEIQKYAKKLQDMGARNVLVSMSKDGSILLTEDNRVIKQAAAQGDTVNTVGSGDSMVAGFIAGFIHKADYNYALSLANAAGSATAFSYGLAKKKEIFNLLNKTESRGTHEGN